MTKGKAQRESQRDTLGSVDDRLKNGGRVEGSCG
eukprot:CAMPEP_0118882928 /NCGR_PEP_ID=MMETSP1163-20130328/22082_1 /TAXON_ID=124430 /ORGANISM="Phaeomonas parva, Strain CCMP2877" /LENGTH=33 /DNA_ID= /DNA_START= /DNA_END= /DNA_ORIENTATION=